MTKLLVILAVLASASAYAADRRPSDDEMRELLDAGAAGLMEKAQTSIKAGDDIRDFELPDLGGIQTKSEKLRKDKIFIVRLAKIESIFSDHQIKFLNQIAAEYAEKVAIVDIVAKEDPSTIDEILQKYEQKKVPYTILLDKGGIFAEKYAIKEIPAVLIFDEKGKLIAARRQVDIYILDEILEERQNKEQEKK